MNSRLSSDTLAALQSFMSEREEAKKRFDELQAVAEQQRRLVTMDAFEEDWQHSQVYITPTPSVLFDPSERETLLAIGGKQQS